MDNEQLKPREDLDSSNNSNHLDTILPKIFQFLRGSILLLLLCISTLIMFVPILLVGIFKLIPQKTVQTYVRKTIEILAAFWMQLNVYVGRLFLPTRFEVKGLKLMKKHHSYLLMVNHQSWMDIMVLENIFLGKISFAKFFIKDELKWIPILGWVWRIMDFPFMKRYSKTYLKKHPEKKGTDLLSTQKACEKFKHMPLTLVHFSEGTRYSPSKAAKQDSPYRNLLKPKAGGVSLVMNTLGEQMNAILDITIYYPKKNLITLWDYLSGRIQNIKVDIRYITMTDRMKVDIKCKESIQYIRQLVNDIWQHKDQVLERFNQQHNKRLQPLNQPHSSH